MADLFANLQAELVLACSHTVHLSIYALYYTNTTFFDVVELLKMPAKKLHTGFKPLCSCDFYFFDFEPSCLKPLDAITRL